VRMSSPMSHHLFPLLFLFPSFPPSLLFSFLLPFSSTSPHLIPLSLSLSLSLSLFVYVYVCVCIQFQCFLQKRIHFFRFIQSGLFYSPASSCLFMPSTYPAQ